MLLFNVILMFIIIISTIVVPVADGCLRRTIGKGEAGEEGEEGEAEEGEEGEE
jgi:hypothetical protein